MRILLNIILAIVVTFSGLAAEQQSTKSRRTAVQTEVPEKKKDDSKESSKNDTKKQEIPAPRPKEEKKNEVPPKNNGVKAEGNKAKEDAAPAAPQQGKVEKVEVEVNQHYDGIDVSRHQKTIDWDKLATDKNVKYVYIKATEGQSFVDPKFRENIENAHRAGFKVGCYHFLRTGSRIQDQFENFTRNVKKNEQDLLPLLDVEVRQGWTNQQLRDSVKLFVDLLEEHYGCKPMIYTSSSFFNNILGKLFADYPLFIARYATNEPRLDNGAKWILWQYSDRGRLRGIDHAVDLSRFNKGCSLRDILIKDNKIGHQKRRNADVVDKSREKPAAVNVKKEAPAMSKAQEAELKKKQDKDAKAKERAEKMARDEAKKREEQEKKEAKEREKRAAREKAVRQRVQSNFMNTTEYQKSLEQAEKQAEREAKEREKAEKAAREKAEKAAKQAAKEREKAEKAAREKAAREKAAQEKAEREAEKKVDKMVKEEIERQEHEEAEKAKEEAKQKAIADKRAKAQAKAQAELEAEAKAEAAKSAQQKKKQEQKSKLQQQKAASTDANSAKSTATPTRKRTNKSSADND